MIRLGDIAEIRTGFPFRKGVKPSDSGQYRLVQIKDISDDQLSFANLMLFDSNEIRKEHILDRGDVLLVARGERNRAVVFEGEHKAVVGLQFVVISPKRTELNSYYLACVLNQPTTQNYLRQQAMGSHTLFIPTRAIFNLDVPDYPLSFQQTVGKIYELSLHERRLTAELNQKRIQLLEAKLDRAVHQHSTT